MTIDTILLTAGLIFLFIALIGGGFTYKDSSIPKLPGGIRFVVGLLGFALTIPFLAPLIASKISDVPSGTIVAFHSSGGRIPLGWTICNGDNGAPNLAGMFLRGVGTLAEEGLDATAKAAHTHRAKTTNVAGNIVWTTDKGNDSIAVRDANHTHEIVVDEASSIPPNYKLVYIMKL